jgi:poly-gamma-glutamate synthesis protein (capsule biosynthesis protein)
VKVFRRLYAARFPIRRMRLMSAYRGSDDASMAAVNTSAFNCRFVKCTTRWSMHSYGEAIDVKRSRTRMSNAGASRRRRAGAISTARVASPAWAVEGGVLVGAFDAVRWSWGGRWTSSKDYWHFSTTGR